MRILKYTIFISILVVIFFGVWRRSDQKGFQRWKLSFRRAVFLAAILSGLINDPVEAVKPPGNTNTVYQERVRTQEFELWDNNQETVILAKGGGGGESVPGPLGSGMRPQSFPTPPGPKPAGRAPAPPSQAYRATPKVSGQPPLGGLGGAGGGNGNGNNGGKAEFEDQCPVPENKQDQKDSSSNIFTQKPKEKNQCDINEKDQDKAKDQKKGQKNDQKKDQKKVKLIHRIKEDPGLVRAAEKACRDPNVQSDINKMEEQLANGNNNPGIGSRGIGNGIIEHRGKNGGRIFVRNTADGLEVLGKCNKNIPNQNFVIGRVKELYLNDK